MVSTATDRIVRWLIQHRHNPGLVAGTVLTTDVDAVNGHPIMAYFTPKHLKHDSPNWLGHGTGIS